MPCQRLRRVLKKLEQPVSSLSIEGSTAITSTCNNEDDTIGKKRLLINHMTRSNSIFLQAIESRSLKKRKYKHIIEEQHPTTAVLPKESTNKEPITIDTNGKDTNHRTINNDTISNNSNSTKNIIQSIQELRKVYLFGLLTVSKLQDLRDAPDAILPGNFCDITPKK